MLKRLLLAALVAVSLTGCGKTAGMAPLPGMRAAVAPTLFAAGHARKLGFDLNRYQRVQAPKAQLRQLPPVQGLMPTRVDLRANASPVVDQFDLGACTAFAVAKGLKEAQSSSKAPLSALFLYYETRKLRNTVETDSGATVTDAIKAASTAGIAPDATWSYNIDNFAIKPPAAAYAAAPANKVGGAVQLAGLEDIKKALLHKQPVVLGMRLYNTFQNVGPDGLLAVPQTGDVLVGGHAVAVMGYDNKRQVLIVKNSFGATWGDHGYFYLPYAYVTPENVMDIWTAGN